jgi:hypothetical protein
MLTVYTHELHCLKWYTVHYRTHVCVAHMNYNVVVAQHTNKVYSSHALLRFKKNTFLKHAQVREHNH